MNKKHLNPVHVVLEGLPGAGKSNLIKQWCKDSRCMFIPDIGNPKFLEPDFNIDRQYILLQESLKHHLVHLAKRPYVLQERNYLSILAFHKSLEIRGIENSYKDILEQVTLMIESGQLASPDYLLLIDIPPEQSHQHQPNVMMDTWKNLNSLGIIRKFYVQYAKNPLFGENILIYNNITEVSAPWELTDFGKDHAH